MNLSITDEPKDWYFYVRYNLSGVKCYHCKTRDKWHVVGELYSTSLEKIDRIDYSTVKPQRTPFTEHVSEI